ncbi:MAG: type IV pilus modification protein PilV [Deltaproteobacteria bacterium]|nr:type IV pilus modification protein PilV [Deltaproteobacteria bacterium]MDH3898302.1 type IV pilus modification protein PilV [Deltaproteobacteria bacterium]MDH3963088.1 type IV pilus modification protein PilV [Deltaproteobacteria bacterium]
MNSEKQMTTDNHQMKSWGKHSQSGFSMVEVMVAILLLTVGLLALAKMQTQAVASNNYGNQLTEATFLAQDKLEELRLLNECYLAVIAKPELSWTAEDQAVVNNYNSQLNDSVVNWIENDTDSDGIDDQFSWQLATPDHTNVDGVLGVPNPIGVDGLAASAGGYIRTWYVADNKPLTKAKNLRVRITWGNGREVTLDTVLSQ